MSKVRVNHYAANTVNLGPTLDIDYLVIVFFVGCLLAGFAYRGWTASV